MRSREKEKIIHSKRNSQQSKETGSGMGITFINIYLTESLYRSRVLTRNSDMSLRQWKIFINL